jgi:hypothetical protein
MQPADEDESVVVFTQPPRDEICRLLNGDPMVPLTPLENDSIRQVIQEHPDTCREKYPFEWYSAVDYNVPKVAINFPLSWLCLRQATSDKIELAYNAHPSLHYACGHKGPLEVVQFLVERNPDALETASNNGWLPFHYACCDKATLEVVQFLVERNPTALETADISG